MMPPNTTQQATLPFGLAEASHADRRNLIGLALTRVECDVHMSRFIEWVFNVGEQSATPLVKSYAELSARPWGLCCSTSKARSTVARAMQLGLVAAADRRYSSGAQAPAAYSIDWDRIRQLLAGKTPHPPKAPVSTRQGPVSTRQGPVSTEHLSKETTSSCSLFTSGSGSGSRAESADGRTPETKEGGTAEGPSSKADWCGYLGQVPELAAARGQRIDPLPQHKLAYGVFEVLTSEDLRKTDRLVHWHRAQLSAPRPVAGATLADLLLVLAAARHATTLPRDQIRSNRVALFVAVVSRGSWGRVLKHVPAIAAEFEALQARYPGLLTGQEWPPKLAAEMIPQLQESRV